MVKASSTDTSRVSRRKPLACSTTTRLASAARSWGMTVDGAGAEEAERAKDDAGRAHRHGVHGGEAAVERGGNEPGPALGGGFEVGDGDGLAGGVALDAGTFVGLQLEQFQFAGLLGGGSEQAQPVERVGE